MDTYSPAYLLMLWLINTATKHVRIQDTSHETAKADGGTKLVDEFINCSVKIESVYSADECMFLTTTFQAWSREVYCRVLRGRQNCIVEGWYLLGIMHVRSIRLCYSTNFIRYIWFYKWSVIDAPSHSINPQANQVSGATRLWFQVVEDNKRMLGWFGRGSINCSRHHSSWIKQIRVVPTRLTNKQWWNSLISLVDRNGLCQPDYRFWQLGCLMHVHMHANLIRAFLHHPPHLVFSGPPELQSWPKKNKVSRLTGLEPAIFGGFAGWEPKTNALPLGHNPCSWCQWSSAR